MHTVIASVLRSPDTQVKLLESKMVFEHHQVCKEKTWYEGKTSHSMYIRSKPHAVTAPNADRIDSAGSGLDLSVANIRLHINTSDIILAKSQEQLINCY